MNNRVTTAMFFLVLAGIAQGAAAQDPAAKADGPTTAWYVGFGIGAADSKIPDQTINDINGALATANGAATTVVSSDERSTATKFFLGFKFNRNFAVEGGYATLGETSMSADYRSGGVPSTSVGTFDIKYRMSAPFIDAVGILPLGDKWALTGRIGVSYTKTSSDFNGSPLTLITSGNDKSESKVKEKFGAGIDYNITNAFGIRGEWERYKAPDPFSDDDFDIDAVSLSILYHF